MSSSEKVCVVGLGYIGLPTAVVLATSGKQVVGVDVSDPVVNAINSGKAHIAEPDLDGLLHHVVNEGRLKATTAPEEADVFIVAVPTPFKGDHEPDLSFVEAASRSIAPFVRPGNLVILESTVPPGATERMVEWIREERPDLGAPGSGEGAFHVAHCPERVLPGRILVELVENDRVVGGIDAESTELARAFYLGFVRGECVGTTARTAELAKLAENAFRDVNIAFANELSMIADKLSVDVWELIALANRHPRVNILEPGPGVGGHCIAVDPWFIVHSAPEDSPVIRAARETNLRKTGWVVEKALRMAVAIGPEARVLCLGLAYKADVDDLRESPSLEVALSLAESMPGRVSAVEPHIDRLPSEARGKLSLVSISEGLSTADLVLGLVDHSAFRRIGREDFESTEFIDFRGMWA